MFNIELSNVSVKLKIKALNSTVEVKVAVIALDPTGLISINLCHVCN